MSQASFLTPISGEYYPTLPKWGTIQDGELYPLPMWGPPTSGKGGGLWPTPQADRSGTGNGLLSELKTKDGEDPKPGERLYASGRKHHSEVTLDRAVKLWPSPRAQDGPHGPARDSLGDKVRWPTPNVRDHKDTGQQTDYQKLAEKSKLAGQVGGQLNPDWVEWLMGWPIGWTSLESMKELLWLDWDIDPAETDCREMWTTPGAGDIYSKTSEPRKSRQHIGIKSEYLSRQSIKWPGIGPIPRIATGIKNRVNRLKAIGNGQVPLVVSTAWNILSGEKD